MATPRKAAPARKKATAVKTPAVVKKSSARKKPVAKRAVDGENKTAALVPNLPPTTPEQRHRRIAEAAYFIALRKGFEKSDPQKNWFEAEQEVDAQLARDARR